jgi:hypothetical protein
MQLGKLGVSQGVQDVSCKTARKRPKDNQGVKPKKQNFKELEHSVYEGRQRLGRYSRIAPRRYAAYDANDRRLGNFASTRKAYKAVSAAADRLAR